MSRVALMALVFFGSGIGAVASACGPQSPAEDPALAQKPKVLDHTEVKMEVSTFDAGPSPSATSDTPSSSGTGTTGTAATTAPTSSRPDLSDDPFVGGKQDQPVLEKAVMAVRPRLRVCYKRALAADASFGGSATFDMTIGKEGKVQGARFVKREGLSEDMVSCLLPVLKSMAFDGNQKSQVLTLSFGVAPGTGGSAASTTDAGAKK